MYFYWLIATNEVWKCQLNPLGHILMTPKTTSPVPFKHDWNWPILPQEIVNTLSWGHNSGKTDTTHEIGLKTMSSLKTLGIPITQEHGHVKI